jgi:hypothetical protein
MRWVAIQPLINPNATGIAPAYLDAVRQVLHEPAFLFAQIRPRGSKSLSGFSY